MLNLPQEDIKLDSFLNYLYLTYIFSLIGRKGDYYLLFKLLANSSAIYIEDISSN